VLDVLGILSGLDRRNFFGELKMNDIVGSRIEVDELGLVEKIAGLFEPLLSFTHVGGKFDGVSVRAMEGFVDIEDGLHVVVNRWKLIERDEGVTEGGEVDHCGSARLPGVHIQAKELGAFGFFFAQLETGLAGFIGGNTEEDMAIERFASTGGIWKSDFEAKFAGRFGGGPSVECGGEKKDGSQQNQDCIEAGFADGVSGRDEIQTILQDERDRIQQKGDRSQMALTEC
jgi:hypothetical protein